MGHSKFKIAESVLTPSSLRAYVVANPKEITADEIVDWVGKQVANHKKLRGGVVFLESIPKSPSGKILRKDLRELAKRQANGSRL